MASLKDVYFLILNEAGNPQGGTSMVGASGFGILLGATGSVNFGNSTQFFSGYSSPGSLPSPDPFGSSILGGDRNAISGATLSTIVGGQCNRVQGYYNVIAGGVGHLMSGGSNFIGGGQFNRIDGLVGNGMIVGGDNQRIYGWKSAIVGGEENRACSYLSWVGGGRQNTAGDNNTLGGGLGGGWYSVVVGGAYNHAAGFMSSVFHGTCNLVSGENSFIGAGSFNIISGIGPRGCDNSIVGGYVNRIITETGSSASRSNQSSILGGFVNSIRGYSSFSTVLGGQGNGITNTLYALMGGGFSNLIDKNLGGSSTIIGGAVNTIDGAQSSGIAAYNSIINGYSSCILGSRRSSILNSTDSRICYADYATILGGSNAIISSGHTGAMILADNTTVNIFSSGRDTLLLDFNNGVYFNKTGVFGLINFSTRPRVNGTGILLSGEVVQVDISTTVRTTGNQTISGSKTFNTRPNVNGTGVLLIGEGSNISVENIVYTTGNQEIDGIKTFTSIPTVNGDNLALEYNIVDLFTDQYIEGVKTFSTTPKVVLTPVALSDNVVDLSSNQNVNGTKNFLTTPIVNGNYVALSNDVVDLSNNQNVNGTKNFSSRPTVNNVGVLLIGEAGGAGQDVVYTTGDQIITGNKTFDHGSTTTISNLAFRSTSGQLKTFSFVQQSGTLTQQIDYINDNLWITRGPAFGIYNAKFEEDWNSSVSPQGTLWNLDGWNDLSNLDSRNYSGFKAVNNNHIGNNVTGKNFIMKDVLSDRYYKIRFTGWEVQQGYEPGYRGFGYTRQEVGPRAGALLSGQAVFDQRPIVSGKSVLIEGDIQGGGLVSTTGDQAISGLKNFFSRPTVNNSGVLLFGEANPSPIAIFGNGSSQGNAASLNFAGGGISVNTVGSQATITVSSSTQTTTVPISSNSAGVSGAFSFDKNYLYYCIENNKWIRTALSTW